MVKYFLYLLGLLLLTALPTSAGEPMRTFPRGARPSPRYKLQAATPHRPIKAAPAQFAVVPKQLSAWYNDQYGDCVTAQEAFSKAAWSVQCGLPELFIPDAEVKRWASKYGFLNGANLTDVMDQMQKDGFTVSGQNYKDGPYNGVDYSNETILQSAIYTGPVNIAIDADALPSGAGNQQGWYAVGKGRFPNTDHCVALSGYGPAEYLYKALGVTLPTPLAGRSGYLLFTWSTIGFVDHDWLMSTCVEAWVRNPTTPGQSPDPGPGPGPTPDPTPTPGGVTITLSGDLKAGVYKLVGGQSVVVDPKMTLEELVKLLQKREPMKPADPPTPPTAPPKDAPEPPPVNKPRPKVGEDPGDGQPFDSDFFVKRFPAGMERFEPARSTQRLFRIDWGGSPRDMIEPFSINLLPKKWHTSGGMEGITGVDSDKYRLLPRPPKVEVGSTMVSSTAGPQKQRALKRIYADGTRFDDVLSYHGKVFEHRMREKKDGKWSSKVIFTDKTNRPPGYTGLKMSCAECHDQAGTGAYNTGLIPGGDTVISDPLPWNLIIAQTRKGVSR